MKRIIRFRPIAEAELEAAQIWYESQREGLGKVFLNCVNETLDRILQDPEVYPVVRNNARQTFVGKFPYSILYFFDDREVTVLAVFHGRRNPKKLDSRF